MSEYLNMSLVFFIALSVWGIKLPGQTNPFVVKREYPKEVPEELRSEKFERVRASIKNYSSIGGTCSYVITSKSCHALTAAHCISNALTAGKHMNWVSQNEMGTKKLGWLNKKPSEIQFQLSEYSLLPSSDGKDAILKNGQPLLSDPAIVRKELDWFRNRYTQIKGPLTQEYKDNKVQLLAMGSGIFSSGGLDTNAGFEKPIDDNELENFYTYMRDTKTEIMADYAMIKLPGENCTCVRAGKPKDNNKVVVVGYPGESQFSIIDGGIPGTSRKASFSTGYRCAPSMQNTRSILASQKPLVQFLFNIFNGALINKKELIRKTVDRVFKSQIISHTAFSSPGVSGGGLLNDDMELIGINTMGEVNDSSPDFNSTALSIEYIQQELKTQLSEQEYSSAFDCP